MSGAPKQSTDGKTSGTVAGGGARSSIIGAAGKTMTDIERYQKQEKIGKGSFGDVYKGITTTRPPPPASPPPPLTHPPLLRLSPNATGIDAATGKVVAIKVIDLENANDELDDIRSEITILSQCKSEYITQYHTSYIDGQHLCIVMEYLGASPQHRHPSHTQ